jgi:TPR repeat protein
VDGGAWPCPACGKPIDGADARACPSCGDSLVVCADYRITGHIGRTVYRGVREKGGRPVAIKIMAPPGADEGDDWTAWELFDRSCKVLQQLEHRALPKVHAYERTDKGRLVLVRESFEGGTLDSRVTERDERLSPEAAEEMLEDLLELLVYLQDRVPPVIHRDIKPSNIMFRGKDSDAPVLVDFDTIVSRRSGLTIVGTPGYAAPEQFAAEAVPASDVYGVGTTMLFVATHVEPDDLPRKEGRFDVAGKLASLDEGVRDVLLRMIEPDLAKRFVTAKAALDALHAAHAHEEAKREKKEPEPEHSKHRGKRKRARERRAEEATKAKPPPKPVAPAPRPTGRDGTTYKAASIVMIVTIMVVAGVVLLAKKSTSRPTPAATTTKPAKPIKRDPNAVLEQSCSGGNGPDCFDLAQHWDNGTNGLKKNRQQALAHYIVGCDAGDGPSCNNLGVAYGTEDAGVTVDYAKAAELYEKACGLKNALACANLGLLYAQGHLGPRNPKKALEWRSRACDLNNGDACNDIGVMYENGDGMKADVKKAASYYGLSCDHGDAWGCRNYGLAYRDGEGVEKDDRRAVALFKRSCDGKEADGCMRLGQMVAAGRGVEKDLDRAEMLLEGACHADVKGACEAMGLVTACKAGSTRSCDELQR